MRKKLIVVKLIKILKIIIGKEVLLVMVDQNKILWEELKNKKINYRTSQ